MVLHLVELATTMPLDWTADTAIHWQISHLMHSTAFDHATIFAQNMNEIKSIDVMADFQKAWAHFIKSGQVWALGIGLVIGWVLHSFIGS